MRRLRISYVLPKLVDHPIGGYKVHYQYADELARRGHRVTLIHPITDAARAGVRDRIACRRAQSRHGDRPPITWFPFDRAVQSVVVPALAPEHLPDADATILTAWQTAARTLHPPRRAGALFQVVYDYEFWVTRPDLRPAIAAALARRDVEHVATSGVVDAMLREIGVVPVGRVAAGLTDGEFGLDVEPASRADVVGFSRRFQPSKDPATARAAIEAIHASLPEAAITCFGDAEGPELPAWVERVGRVSPSELRAFYNRCAVFLLTSTVEGWGLPALEAMACGAAVVSTASGGVTDFLDDGTNGLVVPVGDAAALAASAGALLSDRPRRVEIAERAASDAARFTVTRSADRLESLVLAGVADAP